MMIRRLPVALFSGCSFAFHASTAHSSQPRNAQPLLAGLRLHGLRKEAGIEEKFLAVPNAKLAGEHLKTLTAEPHIASSPEDRKTAEYVAEKFRAAGLETEIVPYRVLMNQPKVVQGRSLRCRQASSSCPAPRASMSSGDPVRERSARRDALQRLIRLRRRDRRSRLRQLRPPRRLRRTRRTEHVDLHGKIVIVRYGANFRGVKVYIAEQRGAAGVLIYSDPQDDGYFKGDTYPNGPWRPETGVQRGSVQYLFKYPGDPETPGVASTPDLPDSARINPEGNQPHIISIPLSYHDAAPILQGLKGPGVPAGLAGCASLPLSHRARRRDACTSSRSRTTSAAPSGM